MPILEVRRGTTDKFRVTGQRIDGQALTYAGTELLTAQFWRGGDTAPISALTCAWITAPNVVELVIGAASMPAAGRYNLRIIVDPQGTVSPVGSLGCFAECQVDVIDGPGTANIPSSYCTFSDLTVFCPSIRTLQSDAQLSQFAEQRAIARKWYDMVILRCIAPHYSYGESSFGEFRFSNGPAGRSDSVRTALAEDRLILNEDVVWANACYALSVIFGGELQPVGNFKPFELAASFRCRAESYVRGTIAEIDLSPLKTGDGGKETVFLGRTEVTLY